MAHNVTLYIMYSQHKISSSYPVQCKIHRKLLSINSHNIHFSFSTSRRCLGSPAANKKKINLIQKKLFTSTPSTRVSIHAGEDFNAMPIYVHINFIKFTYIWVDNIVFEFVIFLILLEKNFCGFFLSAFFFSSIRERFRFFFFSLLSGFSKCRFFSPPQNARYLTTIHTSTLNFMIFRELNT